MKTWFQRVSSGVGLDLDLIPWVFMLLRSRWSWSSSLEDVVVSVTFWASWRTQDRVFMLPPLLPHHFLFLADCGLHSDGRCSSSSFLGHFNWLFSIGLNVIGWYWTFYWYWKSVYTHFKCFYSDSDDKRDFMNKSSKWTRNKDKMSHLIFKK